MRLVFPHVATSHAQPYAPPGAGFIVLPAAVPHALSPCPGASEADSSSVFAVVHSPFSGFMRVIRGEIGSSYISVLR